MEKKFHTIVNGLLNTTVNLINDRQSIGIDMLSLVWKFAVLSSDDNYKLGIKSSSNRKSCKNNRIVKASAGHKTSHSNVSAVSTSKHGQDKTNNSGGGLEHGTNVDSLLNYSLSTDSICLSNSNVYKARDYFHYKTFLAASNHPSKSGSGNRNNNNDANNHQNSTPQISVRASQSDYDGSTPTQRHDSEEALDFEGSGS